MKKIVLLMGMVFALALTGCGNDAEEAMQTEAESTVSVTEAESTAAEELEAESITAVTEAEAEPETESSVQDESVEPEESETDMEMTATEAETEETSVKEVTEAITAFEQVKTMYTTSAVNVRRGPSTDYEVISHLAKGQAVEITGQAETGWYQLMVDGAYAYASNKYLSETVVETPVQAEVQTAAQEPQAPAETQAAAPTATVAPAGVIMVGDSRCVQMQAAVGGGGCSWICENSKEYTWFSEVAIPKFDQYVGKGTKVVINMGVNDPEHYNQYVELVNAKAAEWAQRGAKTYFVSVNPVWENPYTDQADVDTFNANVPGMLAGVTWIDTSSWLNINGYRLVDGLHYDDPTYVNIFNLIMGSL